MKAAVWYGGKDLRIEDVPDPKIKKDEILIRVKSVGICGSDAQNIPRASSNLVQMREPDPEYGSSDRTIFRSD